MKMKPGLTNSPKKFADPGHITIYQLLKIHRVRNQANMQWCMAHSKQQKSVQQRHDKSPSKVK